MCGIAGIASLGPEPRVAPLPAALRDALRHRGPDDVGYLAFSDGAPPSVSRDPGAVPSARVWLVHHRLSILDLTESGWQPMSTPDGRLHVVFNGEIYNYRELRSELESLGHRFRSRSDTEVLLTALLEWGPRALPRLVGMFAFCALDVVARQLFLARDFFGIKPLYYTLLDRTFAFASELPPLLALRGAARANPGRLYDYLRFGITDAGGETLFADVHQLPAAHCLTLSLDADEKAEPQRFWSVPRGERLEIGFEEAASALRGLFLESVSLHLRSDVPVGAALSGGIDSSALVAAMRHLQGDELDLHTFSFVAAQPELSEERWAQLAARTADATAHFVRVEPEDLLRDVDALIDAQAEPFGSTSIYAQHRVFRLAAEHGIRVMLDGQGADELLGGYQSYLGARVASLLRAGRWTEALRFARRAGRRPGASLPGVLQRAASLLLPEALAGPARALVGQELVPAWLDAAWFERQGVVPRAPASAGEDDVLRAQLLDAFCERSLPMLLRYEDRNSMAFSIESRVPFLTPELVRFVFSLPEEYLIDDDATGKAVFRQAMRGLVPDPILDRRDKIGFATPERAWLAALGPWVTTVLTSDAARRVPALRSGELRRSAEAALAGRARFDFRVWRWVNVIRWAERFQVSFEA